MLQRIQSLWLLLAASAVALMFVFPIATFHSESADGFYVNAELNIIPESNPEMMAQIERLEDVEVDQSLYIKTWPLMIVAIALCILCVTSIFMFHNRVRQMRMVAFAFLLNVVYIFLLFFWVVDSFEASFNQLVMDVNCSGMSTTFRMGTWISFVSIVALFLAQRGIRKDEAKVRAADRLR